MGTQQNPIPIGADEILHNFVEEALGRDEGERSSEIRRQF